MDFIDRSGRATSKYRQCVTVMDIELFVALMRFLYNGQRADYQGPIGLCHYREDDRSRWIFVPRFSALLVTFRSRSTKYRLTANYCFEFNQSNRSVSRLATDDRIVMVFPKFVGKRDNFKLARYYYSGSMISKSYNNFVFSVQSFHVCFYYC